MLTGEHIRQMNGISVEVCSHFGAVLAEGNRENDHVYLLAGYPPQVSVAVLVSPPTGLSTRMPQQRYLIRTYREHL